MVWWQGDNKQNNDHDWDAGSRTGVEKTSSGYDDDFELGFGPVFVIA